MSSRSGRATTKVIAGGEKKGGEEEEEDVKPSPPKRKAGRGRDEDEEEDEEQGYKPQKRQARPTSSSSSSSSSNPSSSSSSSSSAGRSTRKKTSYKNIDDDEEEQEEERGDDHIQNIFQFEAEKRFGKEYNFQEGTDKQTEKWDKLNVDVQEQLVKTVSRLFLLKGSKNEAITRAHINETLEKIDKNYKIHIDVLLKKTQVKLKKTFGYIVIAGQCIVGCGKANKDKSVKEYYLTSNLNSRKLFIEVTKANSEPGYHGFRYVVFNSIFMSSSKRIVCKDMLKILRQLDPKFPETIVKGSKTTIPDLGDDFLGLISRMVKEKYIQVVQTDEVGAPATKDSMEVVYTFGTRFYLELGSVSLAKAMFSVNSEPVDETFIASIRAEDEEDMQRALEGEED